jgi:hypothetical protein
VPARQGMIVQIAFGMARRASTSPLFNASWKVAVIAIASKASAINAEAGRRLPPFGSDVRVISTPGGPLDEGPDSTRSSRTVDTHRQSGSGVLELSRPTRFVIASRASRLA